VKEAGRSSHILRFGSFAVDLHTEELRRHGRRVKLPQQSFQIMTMLLERPGELVTREEIQEKLWPDDTVVAFETSINAAVRRLRQALGDSAGAPRFVETLARRGYRFIGTLESSPPGADVVVFPTGPVRMQAAGGLANAARASEPQPGDPAPQIRRFPVPLPPRRTSRGLLASGALGLIGAGALAFWLVFSPQPSAVVVRTFPVTRSGRVEVSMPIATDGKRLYFVQRIGGHYELASVSTTGGTPEPLATPFKDSSLFGISPDGSALLVGNFEGQPDDVPLWLLPLAGGSSRRLGDVTAHDAKFSGDGRWLAFANASGLYLANPDGTGARKIFTPAETPKEISWSPDGRWLRFTLPLPEPSSLSIWEVSTEGRGFRRAVPDWRGPRTRWADGESSGGWVRQGQYFVFRSARDGVTGMWAVREKPPLFHRRGNPLPLYQGPLNFYTVLALDEGTRLYFTGDQERRELMRYDSGLGKFVPDMAGVSAQWVSYSRDGEWVAYVTLPERELWRSRIDGSQRQQLTFVPTQAAEPQWSPDGKQIAFTIAKAGWQTVAIIRMDGGTPKSLDLGQAGFPSWAPDGKSLLFHRAHTSPERDAIYSLDLASGRDTEIPGSRGLTDPVYSQDGRYVAAQADQDRKLMLFDLRTRQWIELVTAHTLYGVYWSRDGRWLYYQDLFGGVEQPIYRINILDRRVEHVTTNGPFLRGDVRSYSFKALAPDDSPIIGLARATSDIYAVDFKLP